MPKQHSSSRKITSILAVVIGFIILIWPNILAIAVGLYLVVTGLLDLLDKDKR